jgi:hypothetical protein
MRRASRILASVVLHLALLSPAARAAEPALVSAEDASWRDWAARLAPRADITADFEETRTFSFRREGVVLRGTTRISPEHGLSLEYTEPEQRTVIVDSRGVLVREKGRDKAGPADPRGTAVNAALLNILRFDLPALLRDFEIRGLRAERNWTLELTPRGDGLRRAVRSIRVEGLGVEVRRILLERANRQAVDIRITPRPEMPPFSPGELRRYFRAAG